MIPTRTVPPSARRDRLLAVAVGLVAAVALAAAVGPVAASVPSPSPPDVAVEAAALTPGLLTPDALGVPADWAIRDVDPELIAGEEIPFADLDPFLGLLSCPDGAIVPSGPNAFVARRYAAPEVPLETGVLTVDIVVGPVDGPETDESDWREVYDECAVTEATQGDVSADEGDIEVGDIAIPTATLELLASSSESVPYPSAYNATIARHDGIRVVVVLGGIDLGTSWQAQADDIAAAALAALAHPSTISTTAPETAPSTT